MPRVELGVQAAPDLLRLRGSCALLGRARRADGARAAGAREARLGGRLQQARPSPVRLWLGRLFALIYEYIIVLCTVCFHIMHTYSILF